MPLMQIVKKLRKLWLRFVKLKRFHSRFGLAQAAVFMCIGRWQRVWELSNGTLMRSGSSGPLKILDFISTRRVQLTLALFYVSRARIITELDDLSKQVQAQKDSMPRNSST